MRAFLRYIITNRVLITFLGIRLIQSEKHIKRVKRGKAIFRKISFLVQYWKRTCLGLMLQYDIKYRNPNNYNYF